MTWSPITEVEIRDLINRQEAELSLRQGYLWEAIRIMPAKWQQHPWGNEGGGFWAVAQIGQRVVWYNDIEDGFNISRFTRYGEIADYWCNQDDLTHTMQQILDVLDTGNNLMLRLGPPQSIKP